jgi:hypothetical protein
VKTFFKITVVLIINGIKMKNYSYSKYSKAIAYTETSSARQVKRLRLKAGEKLCELSKSERRQLQRSRFAFGTIYPYTFDGLSYIATHHKRLAKEYGRDIIRSAGEYRYEIELPFNDFVHYCLLNWTNSKGYLKDELRKYAKGLKENEQRYFRHIPIGKGDYTTSHPLVIDFQTKPLSKMTELEIRRLRQISRLNDSVEIIQNIVIFIIKPFLNSVLHNTKGVGSGWFSIPSAFQAKIDTTLSYYQKELNLFNDLSPMFLRKYFLYFNSLASSAHSSYLTINAIDLWEHVSPSELLTTNNGNHTYVRNWKEAKQRLEIANEFFYKMKKQKLLIGAKAYPISEIDDILPSGILGYQKTQEYEISFKQNSKKTYHIIRQNLSHNPAKLIT